MIKHAIKHNMKYDKNDLNYICQTKIKWKIRL